MAPMQQEARDPADSRRRISLTREQRDRIDTAAATLEGHAGHDEDPLTMLLPAAELRGVVGEWDVANDARSADPVEQRLARRCARSPQPSRGPGARSRGTRSMNARQGVTAASARTVTARW